MRTDLRMRVTSRLVGGSDGVDALCVTGLATYMWRLWMGGARKRPWWAGSRRRRMSLTTWLVVGGACGGVKKKPVREW